MSIRRQRGLTIIELVMFMVIMGIAAAGIIGVLNLGTKSSADPLRRKQAMLIAEAYMEEVQLAPFTFCSSDDDPLVATAVTQSDCKIQAGVGTRAAGAARPYTNVAEYATQLNTPQPTFAVNGVDRDVNGRALGQDENLNTMGNSSLGAITTTVTLNLLAPAGALGPNGRQIVSTAINLQALRITIVTRYGNGPNDFIQLDGYRTRYAPNN
ncbi:MAG TPA: type II secretion system protein [Duganella sp.]|nr:type II secretion system protein [Duganella sp.]